MLFRLALKNLTRAKRRSLISSAAVVVGIFYLIVGQAFISGLEEGIVRGVIDGMTGHVTIRPVDYPAEGLDHPVDKLIEVTPELRTWLASNTEAWTERTLFKATLTAELESLRVRGVGFDPKRDSKVFSQRSWSLNGALPVHDTDGIMVTSGTAKLLGIKPGDRVVLQVRTHRGAMNAMAVKVASVGTTGNLLFDNRGVFVPATLVSDLLRTDGRPTHVSMLLDDRSTSPATKASIAALGNAQIETEDWIDASEDLLALQRFRRNALNVLVGMLLLMSSMAIANTVLMAAHERTREIGTLRSMGLTRVGVLKLFLIEGSLLGGLAGLLGAGMGAALAYYLSENPIDLNAVSGASMAESGVPMSAYLYTAFSPTMVIVPLLISLAVALIASIYPAHVASKLIVADAVRAD